MTNEWKDTSSYGQGDKERIPTAWGLNADGIRISVHRHIHYPKDVWLLSCHNLGVSLQELKSKDIEGAKAEAIGFLFGMICRCEEILSRLINEEG